MDILILINKYQVNLASNLGFIGQEKAYNQCFDRNCKHFVRINKIYIISTQFKYIL